MRIIQAGVFCLILGIVRAQDILPFDVGYFGYGDRPVDSRYVKAVYDAVVGPSDSAVTIENVGEPSYQAAQQSTVNPQTQFTTESIVEIKPSSRLDQGPATFPPLPTDDEETTTTTTIRPPVRSVQLIPGTVKYTNVEYKPTPYVAPPATLSPAPINSPVPALSSTPINAPVPVPSYPADLRFFQTSPGSAFTTASPLLPSLPTALPPIFSRPGSSYSYYTVPVQSSGIHSRLIYIPAYPNGAAQGGIFNPGALVGNLPHSLGSQYAANLQGLNGAQPFWNANDNLRTSYLSGKYPRKKKSVESQTGNER